MERKIVQKLTLLILKLAAIFNLVIKRIFYNAIWYNDKFLFLDQVNFMSWSEHHLEKTDKIITV